MRFARFQNAAVPVYVAVLQLYFANIVHSISTSDNCTIFLNVYQERILGSSVMANPVGEFSYCTLIQLYFLITRYCSGHHKNNDRLLKIRSHCNSKFTHHTLCLDVSNTCCTSWTVHRCSFPSITFA